MCVYMYIYIYEKVSHRGLICFCHVFICFCLFNPPLSPPQVPMRGGGEESPPYFYLKYILFKKKLMEISNFIPF